MIEGILLVLTVICFFFLVSFLRKEPIPQKELNIAVLVFICLMVASTVVAVCDIVGVIISFL